MLRHRSLIAAQWVLLTYLFPLAAAQELRAQSRQFTPVPPPTGLLNTRLAPRDVERWKAIERIVFAEDGNGQPLHPTLRALWEWVETSGHAVYVEFVRTERAATCTAGYFLVEKFDRRGERHVAVIKLNLANIDQAYVGPEAARPVGFTPFAELTREERYAEVLGHELAHAVHILTDLERTRIVEEDVQQTNELLLAHHARRSDGALTLDLKRRISQRDVLLKALEGQAEAMEKVVWEELSRNRNTKLPYALTQR